MGEQGFTMALITHRVVTAPMKPQMEELWFVRTTGRKALTAFLPIESSCLSSRVLTRNFDLCPTDHQARKSSLLQSKITTFSTSLRKQLHMTFLLKESCWLKFNTYYCFVSQVYQGVKQPIKGDTHMYIMNTQIDSLMFSL